MSTTARQYWGRQTDILPDLDLTKIQRDSYAWFLKDGIQEAVKSVSPIKDFTGGKNWTLEFNDVRLGKPKHTFSEAKDKSLTHEIPIYVSASLTNKQTGEVMKQEVFLGNIPQMSPRGTFIINGVERAVVNQLVRSPGIFFSNEVDARTGRVLYGAELRPLRGSWLEMNVGKRDVITVKIDRHRKVPVSVLLRALGYESDDSMMELVRDLDSDAEHPYMASTLLKDLSKSKSEALIELYQKMRPGEPAVLENAEALLKGLFFDEKRYDLGRVGRYKLNKRLKRENNENTTVLTKEDIVAALRYLINLQNGKGKIDDIDHLSNRRVRSVGELVASSAFRIGLLRLERSIREKMSLTKTDEVLTPSSLVNARPLVATISEFFRRNRLSTILDQNNPLSEVDNLRRLSVMGSGGVTRERASFSMRDINASQYSRIDPVRSPEGPNIGLVTYLALYSRINEYGFLEAPYLRVEKQEKNGTIKMKVTDDIVYLTADDEEDYVITHRGVKISDQGIITDEWVPQRFANSFIEGPVENVQFIDVVPRQVVGTSASLIPFISHDEANRALMGTHMQCQAVPLVKPQSPIVGTGMEGSVAEAMGHVIRARHKGVVESVGADKIVIALDKADLDQAKALQQEKPEENILVVGKTEVYLTNKFMRSAQSTCYNQRITVRKGDKINKGDLLIDGPASENGELALGTNLTIAYASFEGLGYEDAIVVSDKLVHQDLMTSIHIDEYEAQVMDTKLGPEELTNDIPNVSEMELRNLGEDGIVVVGSEVKPGDILVGKIAPKGETDLTPEERLLRAIFGEKAREVRDTSLRLPHGEKGIVIGVKVLDKDKGDELDPGTNKKVMVQVAQLRKITVGDKLAGRHGNKGVISKIVPQADMPHLEDGSPVDIIISPLSVLARMNLGQLLEAHLGWAARELGYKVALPVFEEVEEDKIWSELKRAGLPVDGKVRLIDGRTGEKFSEDTVVGVGYILKLVHMVEDKTHARSTGPYSLVTQQPLGGKAQMGGQRLGEMEVWTLEAHRAAHTLQEMLTLKSDDVVGRAKAFEAIVRGTPIPAPSVPESFNVLVRELNSLGLDIQLIEAVEKEEEIIAEEDAKGVYELMTDPIPGVVPTPLVADDTQASTSDDPDEENEEEETEEALEPSAEDLESTEE
ncbi:MAG: DNA-directed RNA polymerase subunit beta [Patescibacteria group bacterium]